MPAKVRSNSGRAGCSAAGQVGLTSFRAVKTPVQSRIATESKQNWSEQLTNRALDGLCGANETAKAAFPEHLKYRHHGREIPVRRCISGD